MPPYLNASVPCDVDAHPLLKWYTALIIFNSGVACAATEGQNLPCSPYAAAARRRAEYQRHPGISNIKAPQHRADCGDPAMLPRHARAELLSALPEGGSCGLVNRQYPSRIGSFVCRRTLRECSTTGASLHSKCRGSFCSQSRTSDWSF